MKRGPICKRGSGRPAFSLFRPQRKQTTPSPGHHILARDDVILCMITSQAARDSNAIPLADSDFADGFLPLHSHVRPNRLFTADSRIILRSVGHLTNDKMLEIVEAIVDIVRS